MVPAFLEHIVWWNKGSKMIADTGNWYGESRAMDRK